MEIKRFGYYWLDTWVLANVIQLATQEFCMRHLNRKNDPCGRQYDQMTQAARSVRNFPLSAEELRKVLKIKDGNARYLFGCTLSTNRKKLIVCSKLLITNC